MSIRTAYINCSACSGSMLLSEAKFADCCKHLRCDICARGDKRQGECRFCKAAKAPEDYIPANSEERLQLLERPCEGCFRCPAAPHVTRSEDRMQMYRNLLKRQYPDLPLLPGMDEKQTFRMRNLRMAVLKELESLADSCLLKETLFARQSNEFFNNTEEIYKDAAAHCEWFIYKYGREEMYRVIEDASAEKIGRLRYGAPSKRTCRLSGTEIRNVIREEIEERVQQETERDAEFAIQRAGLQSATEPTGEIVTVWKACMEHFGAVDACIVELFGAMKSARKLWSWLFQYNMNVLQKEADELMESRTAKRARYA